LTVLIIETLSGYTQFLGQFINVHWLCAIAHKRKNWVLIDSVKDTHASAIIYSISETAKLNGLNPHYYFEHLLAEIPKCIDENGNRETAKLNQLLP